MFNSLKSKLKSVGDKISHTVDKDHKEHTPVLVVPAAVRSGGGEAPVGFGPGAEPVSVSGGHSIVSSLLEHLPPAPTGNRFDTRSTEHPEPQVNPPDMSVSIEEFTQLQTHLLTTRQECYDWRHRAERAEKDVVAVRHHLSEVEAELGKLKAEKGPQNEGKHLVVCGVFARTDVLIVAHPV